MKRSRPQAEHGPFLEVDAEGIAWLTFDDPDRKVNVLTEEVMTTLAERIDQVRLAAGEGRVHALVIRSGKGGFIAGADVDAIAALEDPLVGEEAARLGQAVFLEVEKLPVPSVAAVHGTCMGGGTELALACRYRLASDSPSTKIGLPEVQLGILPAWGGTTRLPRLIGLQAALDMILTGKTVSASRARRSGLVDQVLPAELFGAKVGEFARERVRSGPLRSKRKRSVVLRLAEDTAPGRRVILHAARKRVLDSTGGHYPAPLRILDVIRDSLGASLARALRNEAAAAGELLVTSVSKNLIHLFRLREAARKRAFDGARPRPVETMGVLGAGVMGGGIAQIAAYNGVRVRMKDIRHEAVASGLQEAASLFRKAVERRKLKRREADQRMELISGGLGYDGFGQADLVVEAVVEKLDVKRAVLVEVEAQVGRDAVLASNTSSLSIDAMAEALERPERFCGMHFFNPVHRMPLVEVVRGRRTSDDALATVCGLSLALGKVPVLVGDGPGFLVNRILGPYLNEAGHLLGDGFAGPDIDRAAKRFGMPMGPLRLVDEVGIDIARHAGTVLYEAFGDRLAPSAPLVAIGETERLGRKGGKGFYLYEGGKEKSFDEGVYEALGPAVPVRRLKGDERTIRARLVLVMINEAARVLEDGIASSAGDVDLAMIMGTGFPPFRGGLLRYADQLHPKTILSRLEEHHDLLGPRFEPAPALQDLARGHRTFYEAYG